MPRQLCRLSMTMVPAPWGETNPVGGITGRVRQDKRDAHVPQDIQVVQGPTGHAPETSCGLVLGASKSDEHVRLDGPPAGRHARDVPGPSCSHSPSRLLSHGVRSERVGATRSGGGHPARRLLVARRLAVRIARRGPFLPIRRCLGEWPPPACRTDLGDDAVSRASPRGLTRVPRCCPHGRPRLLGCPARFATGSRNGMGRSPSGGDRWIACRRHRLGNG